MRVAEQSRFPEWSELGRRHRRPLIDPRLRLRCHSIVVVTAAPRSPTPLAASGRLIQPQRYHVRGGAEVVEFPTARHGRAGEEARQHLLPHRVEPADACAHSDIGVALESADGSSRISTSPEATIPTWTCRTGVLSAGNRYVSVCTVVFQVRFDGSAKKFRNIAAERKSPLPSGDSHRVCARSSSCSSLRRPAGVALPSAVSLSAFTLRPRLHSRASARLAVIRFKSCRQKGRSAIDSQHRVLPRRCRYRLRPSSMPADWYRQLALALTTSGRGHATLFAMGNRHVAGGGRVARGRYGRRKATPAHGFPSLTAHSISSMPLRTAQERRGMNMSILAEIEAVSASGTKWRELPRMSLLVSVVATLGLRRAA